MVPINIETKQKLKRFRPKLHALCDTYHCSKQKNQTGGLLGSVVTGLISAIPALISAFTK